MGLVHCGVWLQRGGGWRTAILIPQGGEGGTLWGFGWGMGGWREPHTLYCDSGVGGGGGGYTVEIDPGGGGVMVYWWGSYGVIRL